MKTRLLIIIGMITISLLGYTQYADALCIENQDWSDAPCYGCRGCHPGLEQEKLDWAPYYDYKGSTWMDAKKQQLETAIHNNSLREWFGQSNNGAHKNVHQYYFLQGDVPNIYGMNFDEALDFEIAWNAVEDNSHDAPLLLWTYHDVILDGTLIETDLAVTMTGDHVPLYHIKVNKYFKGEKSSDMVTAVENPDDLEFDLFENGLFYLKKLESQNLHTVTIASAKTFGNCDARDLIEISPVLPNEKPARSAPILPEGFVDPCVPEYFDVDPDGRTLENDRIPEPEQNRPIPENCGHGTVLEEGICVEETVNSTTSSGKWGTNSIEQESVSDVIPSPLKQMKMGIKLGHVICDKDKVPVWNTHYKPACVFSDTESELIKRSWAKLRLLLPAGPDPVKEMEWTGRNVMSMMLEGTFSYKSTPVETLDDKRKAVEEYSKQYHQGEQYLEYAITPHQDHYNVGNKVQFELLEWGISANCSNLQLRIIDINDQSMFENNFDKLCVDHDGTYGTFNSYSIGDDFEEFVCDKTGYYRIEVSNGNIFPPTILQNFACLDSESVPDLVVKHHSIPSVQEFLQMDCEDLNHLYPEFPSEEVADAWVTRMHECLNEQENDKHQIIELFKNTAEVKAFHMQYQDAQISVRDDHVSYFSGSDDGYLVRMNLYFDENYVLTNTDFHCYYKKVHQFEVPQEDIATTLSKYDCKTYSEMNNEN